MKNFTRVHFTLVRIISLILAIIGFIGVVPFIIAGIVIMANQHFMVPLAALCMFLFPVISLVLGFILLIGCLGRIRTHEIKESESFALPLGH